ncbi:unnamed protein product [Penicillium viridicatum]
MGKQLPSEDTKPDLGTLKVESSSATRDLDFGQVLEVKTTPAMEKKVLRKLDFVLIPLMGGCYMLQYIDKLAISQATLFNLREDLDLKGNEYNWASAIFYFGYFAWSWPSSYLAVRLPLGNFSGAVCVWGGCLMSDGSRRLHELGWFNGSEVLFREASIAPGFALITGMFYTRAEQPSRQAAWFVGNSIAVLLGGLIAYGICNIHITAISQWQLLFLILGAVTSAYGLVLFFTLPDSPAKAVFLKLNERAIAVHRTLKNKTGVLDTGKFKWGQVLMAIKDLQTFSAIIITGFGFSHLEALLIQMPIGGAQLVFLLLTSGFASVVPKSRIIMMIVNTAVSMIGMLLIWKLDGGNQTGKMTGLCLGGVFAANIPLSLSIISSNVAGFTKKSTVSALMFAAYCIGNIAGPQFFIPSEEPLYLTGIKAAMAGLAFGISFLFCLYIFYLLENRRRDRLYGSPREMTETEELEDELSNKTDHEIESFRYVL